MSAWIELGEVVIPVSTDVLIQLIGQASHIECVETFPDIDSKGDFEVEGSFLKDNEPDWKVYVNATGTAFDLMQLAVRAEAAGGVVT